MTRLALVVQLQLARLSVCLSVLAKYQRHIDNIHYITRVSQENVLTTIVSVLKYNNHRS